MRKVLLTLLPALALCSLPWTARLTSAAGATIIVAPSSTTVAEGSGSFDVNVEVVDAPGTGSFEFTLAFDPDVVRYVDIQEGPFLGSTGRSTFCPDPIVNDARSSVRFGCATTGSSQQLPQGSGVLAIVTFQPARAGTSTLALGFGKLADEFAGTICPGGEDLCPVQGGTLTVEGDNPLPPRTVVVEEQPGDTGSPGASGPMTPTPAPGAPVDSAQPSGADGTHTGAPPSTSADNSALSGEIGPSGSRGVLAPNTGGNFPVAGTGASAGGGANSRTLLGLSLLMLIGGVALGLGLMGMRGDWQTRKR